MQFVASNTAPAEHVTVDGESPQQSRDRPTFDNIGLNETHNKTFVTIGTQHQPLLQPQIPWTLIKPIPHGSSNSHANNLCLNKILHPLPIM